MFLISFIRRLLERLLGKSKKMEEDDTAWAQDTPTDQVENGEGEDADQAKDNFARPSLRNRLRERIWGKIPAKESDTAEAQDTLAVQIENGEDEDADQAKGPLALPLQLVDVEKKTQDQEQGNSKPSEGNDGEKEVEQESKVYAKLVEKTKGEKEDGDFLADIFDQKTDEKSSLNHLIVSLPDVPAEELLKEAEEVKVLLLQLPHGRMLRR